MSFIKSRCSGSFRRLGAGAALSAAMLLPSGGCLFAGYDGAFYEEDDVRLDVPHQSFRSHDGTDEGQVGDVYQLARVTAYDVNGWVTNLVKGAGLIVEFLNSRRETSREGAWRVYGPFDDDEGRNLSWKVRIQGDSLATSFEFLVGDRGGENFDPLLTGELNIDGDKRDGNLILNFDSVEAHPEMKDPGDTPKTFEGSIDISFDRDVETGEKSIDIDFLDFGVFREGWLDDDAFFSDESYNFHRNAEGGGTFYLALSAEFDWHGFSGPEQERMQLDAAWAADKSGRARGLIHEVDGVGDLVHGDLQIDECFDGDGHLVWRDVNEPYLTDDPSYRLGEEGACIFDATVF